MSPPATPVVGDAGRPVPWLLLAGVVALLLPVRVALGPTRDIDLYWHLLVGRDILSGTPIAEAGRGWSFATVPDTWVSTQWLAEVLFARLQSWGGLDALLVYRTASYVAVLAVLAVATLWRRPPRAGVAMFTIGALMAALFSQERSQQLTFVLAPLVGLWLERLWRSGRLPHWWLVLPLTVGWANFHGGWVLLPLSLGLASLARLVDHGRRDGAAWRSLLLASGTVLAACVSPSGVANVATAPRFAGSASAIQEWQRVQPWDLAAIPFLLLVVIVVVSWSRGRVRPSRGEVLIVLALLLLGLTAWRNLTPSLLLLAAVVTGSLARAMGVPDPTREPAALRSLAFAFAATGATLALVIAAIQTPVVDPALPQHLIATLRQSPSPQRVLNGYNIAGPLLWFGGGPGHVQVAVDGRADRYGGDYISRYQKAMAAQPGWEAVIDELAPTSALMRTDEALSGVLVAQRGWVVVAREGDYVLLRVPGAAGWPAGPG